MHTLGLANIARVALVAALAFGLLTKTVKADDKTKKKEDNPPTTTQENKTSKKQPESQPTKPDKKKPKGEPIVIKLPRPVFKGTPKHAPPGARVEKPRAGERPPFFAPKGVRVISHGKPVTSSYEEPIIGEMKCVTDSDKDASEGGFIELGPGVQWVQIDLGKPYALHAIVVWHYHISARIYHDVVVQVADDEDFIENVRTLFNNDHDNSAGLGVGQDMEYWDTYEGKLIDAKGEKARYVRFCSRGNTEDEMNHYTEAEVFGLPVK